MSLARGLRIVINSATDRIAHAKKRLCIDFNYWKVDELSNVLPKVYIYDLPAKFKPDHRLSLVSETYFALYDFFRLYCRTYDPCDADYFFVPLNIIQYQFRNENPDEVLNYLRYFDPDRHDHLLVALGDFSQRSKINHFGHAYLETYTWLNSFILLALESTSDLIPNRDIGIIPYNTLSSEPEINNNSRPYLYSFLGATAYKHLPLSHVRNKIHSLSSKDDVLIGSRLHSKQRKLLMHNFYSKNDYELLSRNSQFTLAPAGYGRWTYRFFQAIQWGSIPILLSDDYVKPFEDTIPYDDFCITVSENDATHVDEIIRSFSSKDIIKLQNALKENLFHFTQTAFFYKLCCRLMSQRTQSRKMTAAP